MIAIIIVVGLVIVFVTLLVITLIIIKAVWPNEVKKRVKIEPTKTVHVVYISSIKAIVRHLDNQMYADVFDKNIIKSFQKDKTYSLPISQINKLGWRTNRHPKNKINVNEIKSEDSNIENGLKESNQGLLISSNENIIDKDQSLDDLYWNDGTEVGKEIVFGVSYTVDRFNSVFLSEPNLDSYESEKLWKDYIDNDAIVSNGSNSEIAENGELDINVPNPIQRNKSDLIGKEINGITHYDLDDVQELVGRQILIRKEFMLNDGIVRFIGTTKNPEEHYISKFDQHNITTLYHFTDRSNLQSIYENQGLLSFRELETRNINVEHLSSSEFSRSRDRQYGLDDFVRLSFSPNNPMMYVAMKEGRITDPVVLEIDAHLAWWDDTIYSNMNAIRNRVKIGGELEHFDSMRLDIATQENHFDLTEEEKPFYQAEVMIRNRVPFMFINNLKLTKV